MNKEEELLQLVQKDPALFAALNKMRFDAYNSGLDTAISLVNECSSYENRMDGTTSTLICGLESSKVK